MTTQSPFIAHPPSARRLLLTMLIAMVMAGIVLVAVVLPAEFAIDPTGIGSRLGLTKMSQPSQIELTDTLGGNEKIAASAKLPPSEVKGAPKPLPLPNPAVHQSQPAPAHTQTVTVTLSPFEQTEIKAVLDGGKMMLYSWKVDGGKIYEDFHGHDPAWVNKNAFVRYEEKNDSVGANGSLVAPFTGEHGWYWLNVGKKPVTITLTVQGYYDRIVDYGVSR